MSNYFKFKSNYKPILLASSIGLSSTLGYWYIETKRNYLLAESNVSSNLSSNVNKLRNEHNDVTTSCSCHIKQPTNTITYNEKYKHLVPKLFKVLSRTKEVCGSPGLSFGIIQNGELIMKGGLGYADIENATLCTSESVLRVASISKSLTSVAIGKLIEENLLDIDEPIQTYLPEYPQQVFNNERVKITTRNLLTHTSGIRGYFDGKDYKEKDDDISKRQREIEISKFGNPPVNSDENFIKEHYNTVEDGLKLFQNDPLVYKPDTDYLYSSLAYSVVSRIIEKVTGQQYVDYMKKICTGLGLENTCVDLNDPIIINRARNYKRNAEHRLLNVPYIDNSYKWAGGGYLSNVHDLLRLGNNILASYENNKGYLEKATINKLWEVHPKSLKISQDYGYALGWQIKPKAKNQPFAAYHPGGAVGASSILMLIPKQQNKDPELSELTKDNVPTAITDTSVSGNLVVAIIVNMQSVSLTKAAYEIHKIVTEIN